MKKRRLKPYVKNTLLIILGMLIGIILYQLATETSVLHTPRGDAYCSGGIIKICSGSWEVAEYNE